VGAVLELGERLGVATPNTRAVYACTRLRARQTAPTGEVQ
jgi:ketopantoate reductase